MWYPVWGLRQNPSQSKKKKMKSNTNDGNLWRILKQSLVKNSAYTLNVSWGTVESFLSQWRLEKKSCRLSGRFTAFVRSNISSAVCQGASGLLMFLLTLQLYTGFLFQQDVVPALTEVPVHGLRTIASPVKNWTANTANQNLNLTQQCRRRDQCQINFIFF